MQFIMKQINKRETITLEEFKKFKKELNRLSVLSSKEYREMGELYMVHYTPSFMQKWPNWLIGVGCFILNHLPHRLSSRLERYFNSR